MATLTTITITAPIADAATITTTITAIRIHIPTRIRTRMDTDTDTVSTITAIATNMPITTTRPRPIGMADGSGPAELPGGFYYVDRERAAVLQDQLAREILPGHRLTGRRLNALAERARDDDVLFVEHPDDGEAIHWLVHLTWSRAIDCRYPQPTIVQVPDGLRSPFDDD